MLGERSTGQRGTWPIRKKRTRPRLVWQRRLIVLMAKDVDACEVQDEPATPTEGRVETLVLAVLLSLFAGVGVWTWWRLVQVYLG